jgi:hypothetical protein
VELLHLMLFVVSRLRISGAVPLLLLYSFILFVDTNIPLRSTFIKCNYIDARTANPVKQETKECLATFCETFALLFAKAAMWKCK